MWYYQFTQLLLHLEQPHVSQLVRPLSLQYGCAFHHTGQLRLGCMCGHMRAIRAAALCCNCGRCHSAASAAASPQAHTMHGSRRATALIAHLNVTGLSGNHTQKLATLTV